MNIQTACNKYTHDKINAVKNSLNPKSKAQVPRHTNKCGFLIKATAI